MSVTIEQLKLTLTERQLYVLKVAMSGNGGRAIPQELVAVRLGVTQPAVSRIYDRLFGRLSANGYDPSSLAARLGARYVA